MCTCSIAALVVLLPHLTVKCLMQVADTHNFNIATHCTDIKSQKERINTYIKHGVIAWGKAVHVKH